MEQKETVGSSLHTSAPAADPDSLDSDAVLAQLGLVLSNPLFHNSKRCTSLLRYIVSCTLEGQYGNLKERNIGIEVFGRRPDYDTSLDPTVRVAATEVRKRLALYYNEPGHDVEPRIGVPLRAYLAEFRLPDLKPVLHDEPSEQTRSTTSSWYTFTSLAVVILALAVWGMHRLLTPVPAIEKFWAPALKSPGPVLLCISLPASNDPGFTQPSDSPEPGPGDPGISLYVYTKQRLRVEMREVTAAGEVGSFLHKMGKDSVVRPAPIARLSDLRSSPLVLLGIYDNQWASSLGSNLHFRFQRESDTGKRWIEDVSSPSKRDWTVDMSSPYAQFNSDYALISRVLDPSTGQWWVGIAGLTGMGTLAAQRMLISPQAMAASSASFPKSWERKNLQIVLAVQVIRGSPGAAHVVASYSW